MDGDLTRSGPEARRFFTKNNVLLLPLIVPLEGREGKPPVQTFQEVVVVVVVVKIRKYSVVASTECCMSVTSVSCCRFPLEPVLRSTTTEVAGRPGGRAATAK